MTRPTSELRTRLVMGSILTLLAAGLLLGDWLLERETGIALYPCLLLCVVGMSALAVIELHRLLEGHPRPPLGLSVGGCCALILVCWPSHFGWTGRLSPTQAVSLVFAGVVIAGFLIEMARFEMPGDIVIRLAFLTLIVAYLGFFPTFLVHLRWLPGDSIAAGVTALTMVIFVPKCGDIGAFFTGRALGRHRMSPILSPKKTWEGFAGGLAASILTAVVLNHLMHPILSDALQAAGFGLVVGIAGVLGDLAESLIKRDCRQKDAAHLLPGFGGVLDVIDSILFAGPVAYAWLAIQGA